MRPLARPPRRWPWRRHAAPHFLCSDETDDDPCPDKDAPALGHVCACSCERCSLLLDNDIEVCVCAGCDARNCGLHTAAGAHRGHDPADDDRS